MDTETRTPTTMAEAVEVGARALYESTDAGPWSVRAAAVLDAVGYADLLGEVERLRDEAVRTERLESRIVDILEAERDALVATVAKVRARPPECLRCGSLAALCAPPHPATAQPHPAGRRTRPPPGR